MLACWCQLTQSLCQCCVTYLVFDSSSTELQQQQLQQQLCNAGWMSNTAGPAGCRMTVQIRGESLRLVTPMPGYMLWMLCFRTAPSCCYSMLCFGCIFSTNLHWVVCVICSLHTRLCLTYLCRPQQCRPSSSFI